MSYFNRKGAAFFCIQIQTSIMKFLWGISNILRKKYSFHEIRVKDFTWKGYLSLSFLWIDRYYLPFFLSKGGQTYLQLLGKTGKSYVKIINRYGLEKISTYKKIFLLSENIKCKKKITRHQIGILKYVEGFYGKT